MDARWGRRSGALAALCAAAAVGAAQEPASPRDVFPAGVEQVTVDVVVVDREGNPVKGLVAAAFTVLEDGVRQEIAWRSTSARPPRRPPQWSPQPRRRRRSRRARPGHCRLACS